MNKAKKLFLALLIVTALLFIGCGASIIVIVANDFDTESVNILGLVFLFFHLLILAIVFYLAFKAFYTDKSSLLSVFTLDEKGNVITKTRTVALVISIVFFLLGIYMTLLVFGINMPLAFFAKSLKYALMNVGYSVGIVALFFILYPFTRG